MNTNHCGADSIEDLRKQLDLVTGALDALVQDVDPANHQSFCECDPNVGYQCNVCAPWPILNEARAALAAVRKPAGSPAGEGGDRG